MKLYILTILLSFGLYCSAQPNGTTTEDTTTTITTTTTSTSTSTPTTTTSTSTSTSTPTTTTSTSTSTSTPTTSTSTSTSTPNTTTSTSTSTSTPNTTTSTSTSTSTPNTTTSTSTPTNTTSAITSTSTPTSPTTPKPVPEYTCKDNTDTQIRLEGLINLVIEYNTTKNELKKAYIDVPTNIDNTTGSECTANSTRQVLVVNFFPGWSVSFEFSRITGLQADAEATFFVNNITIVYIYDDHFPDAKDNVTAPTIYLDGGKNYLKASNKGYYSCKSNVTVGESKSGVKMTLRDFKYTAFSSNNATLSGGDVTECSADEETSSVVPIAVGAALAGLVVIVLIAYLIGRRRSHKSGYESV